MSMYRGQGLYGQSGRPNMANVGSLGGFYNTGGVRSAPPSLPPGMPPPPGYPQGARVQGAMNARYGGINPGGLPGGFGHPSDPYGPHPDGMAPSEDPTLMDPTKTYQTGGIRPPDGQLSNPDGPYGPGGPPPATGKDYRTGGIRPPVGGNFPDPNMTNYQRSMNQYHGSRGFGGWDQFPDYSGRSRYSNTTRPAAAFMGPRQYQAGGFPNPPDPSGGGSMPPGTGGIRPRPRTGGTRPVDPRGQYGYRTGGVRP